MERDTIFYILDRSSSAEREFVSGVVVGGGGDTIVIQFGRPWLGIAVDESLQLYFKHNGQFMSREYRVERVTEDDDGTRLKLHPLGAEPEPSDMRSSERIPTVCESLTARFGSAPDCVLLDISTSGLALICGDPHRRGEVVELEMHIREGRIIGEVTVASAIEVRPGRYRYGLKCRDDKPGHNLRQSLPQLWVALQLKYLEIMMT